MSFWKSRKSLRYLLPIAAAVIVSAAALWAVSGQAARPSTEPALQTATARRGDLTLIAGGSGSLVSAATVDVRFQAGGPLVELNVALGDAVEAGQVLARIDDSQARASLAEAEMAWRELTSSSALAQARLDLAAARSATTARWNDLARLISPAVLTWEERVAAAEQAVAEADSPEAIEVAERALRDARAGLTWAQAYYRDEYLADTFTYSYFTGEGRDRVEVKAIDIPTQDEIDEARAALDLARAAEGEAEAVWRALNGEPVADGATGAQLASLDKARLALEAAQDKLDDTRLIAPISGTVTALDLVVGQTVSSADGLTLMDLSRPTVEFFVDETDVELVAVDNEVEVIFDAYPDLTFAGRVVQLDPTLTVSGGVRAIRGLAVLEESAEATLPRLYVGLSASIDVIAGRARGAVLVPVEALRQVSPGRYAVFVVGDDGGLVLRPVEVGLQDLTYAVVTSGLEAGDVVSTGIAEVSS
jgi:HlyD family secretion protein